MSYTLPGLKNRVQELYREVNALPSLGSKIILSISQFQ